MFPENRLLKGSVMDLLITNNMNVRSCDFYASVYSSVKLGGLEGE